MFFIIILLVKNFEGLLNALYEFMFIFSTLKCGLFACEVGVCNIINSSTVVTARTHHKTNMNVVQ